MFGKSWLRHCVGVSFCFVLLVIAQLPVFAQVTATASGTAAAVQPVPNPCPRFAAGSVVHQPAALFSQNGLLAVRSRIKLLPTLPAELCIAS